MPGVGTRLKEKFTNWNVHASSNCGCDSLAKTMDTSGPTWCRNRFNEILDRIRDNAVKLQLPFAKTVAEFSVVRLVVASMLDDAIREEEEHLATLAANKAKCQEDRIAAILEDVRNGPRSREHRWQWQPDVIEAHRRIFKDRISEIQKSQPQPSGFGRGVVTLGGGLKYFPAAYVLCHMLRKLGCTLPIEVWYLNRYELDPKMESLLTGLGDVRCVDGSLSVPTKPRCWGGWEAKPWAIQHSEFDEVLFLDADIVPARDPSYLFDAPEYLASGAVFWPNWDHAVSYTASKHAWEVLGLQAPGRVAGSKQWPGHDKPTDYIPCETGQMLFSKRECWYALEVAKLLSDHSDFWFPAGAANPVRDHHSYGDTAIIPLAFEATGTSATAISKICNLFGDRNGGGLQHYDFQGEACWEHRCLPIHKIRVTGSNPTAGLSKPAEFTEAINTLKGQWKALPWDWRDQTGAEFEVSNSLVGEWFGGGLPLSAKRVTLNNRGGVDGGRGIRWRTWLGHPDRHQRLIVADPTNGIAVMTDTLYGWEDQVRGAFLWHSAPKWWDGIATPTAAMIWNHITRLNEYRLPSSMSGMMVVDVGANEGAFSHECYSRGASRVVSVEPNRLTYSQLVRNLDQHKTSICLNAAVWPDGEARRVALENRPGTEGEASGCSVVARSGSMQLVPVVTVPDILEIFDRDRADLLKLDCEGSEWPILIHAIGIERFDAIVAELHYGMLWDRPDWWRVPKTKLAAVGSVAERLKMLGFSVEIRENPLSNDPEHHGLLFAWRGCPCPFGPD